MSIADEVRKRMEAVSLGEEAPSNTSFPIMISVRGMIAVLKDENIAHAILSTRQHDAGMLFGEGVSALLPAEPVEAEEVVPGLCDHVAGRVVLDDLPTHFRDPKNALFLAAVLCGTVRNAHVIAKYGGRAGDELASMLRATIEKACTTYGHSTDDVMRQLDRVRLDEVSRRTAELLILTDEARALPDEQRTDKFLAQIHALNDEVVFSLRSTNHVYIRILLGVAIIAGGVHAAACYLQAMADQAAD